MGRKSALISQKRLKELCFYDGTHLRWRVRRRYAKKGNPGEVVGSVNNMGYLRTTIDGRQYLVHRLIWLYTHGKWPEMIDHINRNKLDNRIENLREADMALNVRNRNAYPSKTGVKGVYPCRNKYRASIQRGYVQIHLGVFDSIKKASKARKEAEKALW